MNRGKAEELIKKAAERQAAEKQENNANDPKANLFPWLAPKDLTIGSKYTMRLLPPHPDKNPDGYCYIGKLRVDMSRPTDRPYERLWTLSKDSYLDQSEASGYLEALAPRIKEHLADTSLLDLFGSEDLVAFGSAMEGITKPWETWEMPILLWAECDTTKVTKGDKTFSNFVNYRPKAGAVMGRLFQVGSPYVFKKLIELDIEVSTPKEGDEEEGIDRTNRSLWSTEQGYEIGFTKEAKKYNVELGPDGVKKLKRDFVEKYGPSSEAYPNLVGKLEKLKHSEQELRDACANSWWGQILITQTQFEF